MTDVPLILSLETATLAGSVWLGRGKLQLATRNGDPQVSQSNSLLSDISASLNEAGIALEDIELFACAAGPGSFTGLRIGIATLKALAATMNHPCVGIPTLHAVAHSAGASKATVAVLPAGRGEVFAQMFSVTPVSGELFVKAMDTAAHLSPEKLINRYGLLPTLKWAGSGAHLQRATIEAAAAARGIVLKDISAESAPANGKQGWDLGVDKGNLAQHVAALAQQSYAEGVMQRADELQAIYVRPSDAELNIIP
jgi:tRNA threonylcarbamoyl adenosine modification protein YeaZ